MNFLTSFNTGFFNTVQYDSDTGDNSLFSKLEQAADVCRAPGRWVASEIWEGGKIYSINYVDQEQDYNLACDEIPAKSTQGIQKIVRFVVGLMLSLPGQVLALPLMGIAVIGSEEIWLKHTMSIRTLSDAEKQKLEELIQKRQALTSERQGNGDDFCKGFICGLLCCLCFLSK